MPVCKNCQAMRAQLAEANRKVAEQQRAVQGVMSRVDAIVSINKGLIAYLERETGKSVQDVIVMLARRKT